MNKTKIKNFAVWARTKLITDIKYKANLLGITENGISEPLPQSTDNVQFFSVGLSQPYAVLGTEIKQRNSLIKVIENRKEESNYVQAYESVMEEVAYTWFNRLIAIRFMEVNDYLPSHIRVLSSDSGKSEPDLVTNPFDAELLFSNVEIENIQKLKNENKLDEVFNILFVKQCNALHSVLPRLFENVSDYTELLLKLSYIDPDGVVYRLVHEIDEEDFDVEKGGQVEIIGWLYQYYIAEPKDSLINAHKKYKKNDIAFVTQLFTSEWIVKYLVENSLGRLWIESHPESELQREWNYYLVSAKKDSSMELEEIEVLNPEDIRIIDPCMGSGHILVYAFDLLMQIYENCGWTKRDAAKSIVENNLYGLDIDKRAGQLAYFSIMMKARQFNRRILDRNVKCNINYIVESNGIDNACLNKLNAKNKQTANKIVKLFLDASVYGSLLKIDVDEKRIYSLIEEIDLLYEEDSKENIFDYLYNQELYGVIRPLAEQALIIGKTYNLAITNPPYMNASLMPDMLKKYVADNYQDFKNDLFAAFTKRLSDFTCYNGHIGLLMPYVWMFISSYEKMRKWINQSMSITSLVQLEYNAFEAACVPVAALTLKRDSKRIYGEYVKLSDFRGAENQGPKTIEAVKNAECGYRYSAIQTEFLRIPGQPIVYWATEKFYGLFSNKPSGEVIALREGIHTGQNDLFLRLWYEVNNLDLVRDAQNMEDVDKRGRWVPYSKGGSYRKWYGNNDLVIGFDSVYRDRMAQLSGHVRPSQNLYFKEGGTWSALTSGNFGLRYQPPGHLFDSKGQVAIGDRFEEIIGLFNLKVYQEMADMIMPTLDYKCGDVKKLPYCHIDNPEFNSLVKENIEISKEDWDSFETSMDFKRHPLL